MGENAQKPHIQLIKERLVAAKERYEKKYDRKPVTAYEINAKLNKKMEAQGKNCPTIPTIAKLLDAREITSSSLIDITLVAELCKWFECSLSYVLALPEDESVDLQELDYGTSFSEFEDRGYFGTLHGYMLRRVLDSEKDVKRAKNDTVRKNDSLVHCIIDLEKGEMLLCHDPEKEDEKAPVRLSGKPIRSNETGTVWVDFVSEQGLFYHVMFKHRKFRGEPMFYREAVVLTTEAGKDQLPMVGKMVLFRNEVRPEQFEYVRGLLALDVENVILSKDQFDQLAREDEEIGRFQKEFADYLALYERPFYVFPEQIIDINQRAQMSSYEMKRVILKLRNHSYSQAQILVGNDSKASTVAKEIQDYHSSSLR